MAGDGAEALPETAKRQVLDVVPVLPFEDEPATFVLVLRELADAMALDDEAPALDDKARAQGDQA